MDGKYLPHHPFDPSAPPESRGVPLSVSTTLEDAALRLTNWDLTESGLTALLNERYKGKAAEILELYRPVTAGKTPYLVQAQIFTDTQARSRAIAQAERKAAQGGAGVWIYIWEWPTRRSTKSSAPCTATTSTRRSICIATASAGLVFDATTRVVNDPRGAIRKYWSRNAQPTEADD